MCWGVCRKGEGSSKKEGLAFLKLQLVVLNLLVPDSCFSPSSFYSPQQTPGTSGHCKSLVGIGAKLSLY